MYKTIHLTSDTDRYKESYQILLLEQLHQSELVTGGGGGGQPFSTYTIAIFIMPFVCMKGQICDDIITFNQTQMFAFVRMCVEITSFD